MKEFKKNRIVYVVVIILTQIFLLLSLFWWKKIRLFDMPYKMLTNIVLFIVIGLSILSLLAIKELFNVIEEEIEVKMNKLKMNKLKLEEHKKMIVSLSSQNHDFLNQLQIIYGMIQLNKKENVKEYIKSINKDLIDIEIRDSLKEKNVLDYIVLIKKNVSMEWGIKFDFKIDDSIKDVNLPTNKLIRVVSNLVDNAIDATKKFIGDKVIVVTGENQGDKYLLKVYNSGPIIRENFKNKIFEAGFSTKGRKRGFGLYIVVSLIEEFGGKLKLKSEEGYGTEFSCYFNKEFS